MTRKPQLIKQQQLLEQHQWLEQQQWLDQQRLLWQQQLLEQQYTYIDKSQFKTSISTTHHKDDNNTAPQQ